MAVIWLSERLSICNCVNWAMESGMVVIRLSESSRYRNLHKFGERVRNYGDVVVEEEHSLQLRKLGEGVRNDVKVQPRQVKMSCARTPGVFNAAGCFCGPRVLSLRGHMWIPG